MSTNVRDFAQLQQRRRGALAYWLIASFGATQTLAGCTLLFDPDSYIGEATGVDGASADASLDSAVTDSAVTDSAVTDSGVADSGVTDSGVTDSGVTDSGVTDSGVTDSGVTDSGVTDSGVADPCSLCALDEDCVGDTCVACTPVAARIATASAPTLPAGTKLSCATSASDLTPATDCPVVACGGLTTWAFSYTDNSSAFAITTYDPDGTVLRSNKWSGARYVWDATVSVGDETATFYGQGTGTVTIPWSEVRLP